jgi:class 3 adenylate cyclase
VSARTLTVVFTDIKGFTERTSRSSREALVRLLERHEALLLPVVMHFGGQVVKTIGDAFLLTFDSPTNAVLCGLVMQDTLSKANADVPEDEHIEIRVAINTGEVELIGNDIFGETVNVAARIEGITDAGEVYFAESTYLAMQKAEVPTSEVGLFRLKGIPEQIKVYKVVFDENLDLYKQVLASQQIDREATTAEARTGNFSSALLYSVEQQQAIATDSGTGRWIFAATLLVLAVIAGWFGWGEWQYRSERAATQQLIDSGDTREALDQLLGLREQRPTDGQLRGLLEAALSRDIALLAEADRFEEAIVRLDEGREQFPFLQIHDSLRRSTLLQRAEHIFPKDTHKGQAHFEKLIDDYPGDLEIRYRNGKAHIDSKAGRWDVPMYQFQQLVEAAPEKYRDDPMVRQTLVNALDRHLSSGLQEIMAKHYFEDPDVHAMVLENLYAAGPKNSGKRRNALGVLEAAGKRDLLDEGRYFTIELLTRTHSDGWQHDETTDWWNEAIASGKAEDLVPDELPEPVILREVRGRLSKQVLPIIEQLFVEGLRDFLMKHIDSPDQTGYRVHAYRFGSSRGWISAEQELSYHLANLRDQRSGTMARTHVIDSVNWFATRAPRTAEAVEPLRKIRDRMAETWKAWGGEEGGKGNQVHARLRDSAARALRRMGGR